MCLALWAGKRPGNLCSAPLVLPLGVGGAARTGSAQERPVGASDPPGQASQTGTEQEGSKECQDPDSNVTTLIPGWGHLARHVDFLSFTWKR